MQYCNICVKNTDQVAGIKESTVTSGGGIVKIEYLLQIFRNDIVKFLLEDNDTLICNSCLRQLKICYDFIEQIKESKNKLNKGKEIKTEHDYFEVRNAGKETINAKLTVHDKLLDKRENSNVIKSNLNFKPILPKSASATIVTRKVKKTLEGKSRVYKCLQCTEAFKSYNHLNEHEKNFCKSKLVKCLKVCKFCNKCYSNEKFLSEHVSLKHGQGEFLCCMCQDKVFTAKGYLSRHIRNVHHHKSLKFFCGECTDIQCLPTPEDLRHHFLQSHPSESIKTTQMTLNDEDMDLEMHEEFLDEFLLAHTNENSFQFSECWEALDLHLPDMLQVSGANTNNLHECTQAFSCPKCYEQFKSPQPLLNHLADIHDLPVLICRICSKCFSSFKDFKRHKLQKCTKNFILSSITLECPYCSKNFKNATNLKQHIRIIHCQLKKHICQLCDKQFSTLDHLKKHVLSQHQNERKHVCTVCSKKFTQSGHLKQHLAIHTTGKQFQCSDCSLKYWRKIDLEKHHQKDHRN